MKLNEVLTVSSSEKGFFILRLESPNLNLETLQSIPPGLEKIKQFSKVNGVVLYIKELKGPSFHDFNLYTQKEGLFANFIDAGKNCILSFNNLNLPFGVYVEKCAQDMAVELLLDIPKLFFSPNAFVEWSYSQIPVYPLFGNIKKFFDLIGIKNSIDFFLNGKKFFIKDLFKGIIIPKVFLIEGLEYYFRKGSNGKDKAKNYYLKKIADYVYWKKIKKYLKEEFLELSSDIINLYLKNKLFQEEEEIYQRNYLLKERVRNKLRYLLMKEELFNQEVIKDMDIKKSFLSLGFSANGRDILNRGLKKEFKVRILEKNFNILKENINLIPKNEKYSISINYYGFERYPIIFENLSCKEEEKIELIGTLSNEFEIDGVFLVALKTLTLKSIEKRFSHPTRILGYHIPPYLPNNDFVEIIKGSRTSQESLRTASKFFSDLGFFPLVVSDKPGFLVLRILSYLINEAFDLLEEGYPPKIIEDAFKIHGFKKGPFQLGDEIGFSTLLSILQINSLTSKELPSVNKTFSVLAELERFEKRFPVKFFSYNKEKTLKENKRLIKHLGLKFTKKEILEDEFSELSERLFINLLNISFNSIEQGVVDWADKVDLALSFVIGTASSNLGIIKHSDNLGWQHIIGITNRLVSKYGTKYAPCKSIVELSSAF